MSSFVNFEEIRRNYRRYPFTKVVITRECVSTTVVIFYNKIITPIIRRIY